MRPQHDKRKPCEPEFAQMVRAMPKRRKLSDLGFGSSSDMPKPGDTFTFRDRDGTIYRGTWR